MTKTRKRLLKLLLLTAGLFVGVVVAELGLRLMGIGYPLPYAPDPHCATRLRPGFQGVWLREGRSRFKINRAGYRDKERTKQKPRNTFRVALLGDSFVEAFQVPLGQTVGAVLERELATCPSLDGKEVEVLNFGVSGYGTAQELLTLRRYAAEYHPDAVVLAFFPGNDLRNNSSKLEPYRVRPFFFLDGDELHLDNSFREHPDYLRARSSSTAMKVWLINRLRILQLVNEVRNRTPRQDQGGGINDVCLAEPRSPEWVEAWELTERLVQRSRDETEQRGARFYLVMVSDERQVHPDPEVRDAACKRLGVSDLLYPNRRLQKLGEQSGFQVIDFVEPMRQYAENHQVYLHGFDNTELGTGHWNKHGHQLAGQFIAEAMCEDLDRKIRDPEDP